MNWIQWPMHSVKKLSRYSFGRARMLVVAGTDPRAWSRAWHVPSDAPLTQRQAIEDLAKAAGVGPMRVGTIPPMILTGLGLVWPLMRELREAEYQFRDAFVMDSSAARTTFGLDPTPWQEIVAVTVGGTGVQESVELADQ